jgi:hypothetical protein
MLEKGLLVVSVFVPVFKGLISFFIHFFLFFCCWFCEVDSIGKDEYIQPYLGFWRCEGCVKQQRHPGGPKVYVNHHYLLMVEDYQMDPDFRMYVDSEFRPGEMSEALLLHHFRVRVRIIISLSCWRIITPPPRSTAVNFFCALHFSSAILLCSALLLASGGSALFLRGALAFFVLLFFVFCCIMWAVVLLLLCFFCCCH